MDFLINLFSDVTLKGVAQIIFINLILSGDNALVIAMVAGKLPKEQQNKVIIWGGLGATIARIILTIAAVYLLKIPLIEAAGGIFLIKIAFDLLKAGESDHEAAPSYKAAIFQVLKIDIIMGLDSVLAIAGAASGSYGAMIIGLLVGVPLVLGGSKIFTTLLDKFPIIAYIGSGVILHTALEMIFKDEKLNSWFHFNHHYTTIIAYTVTIVAMVVMYIINKKHSKK